MFMLFSGDVGHKRNDIPGYSDFSIESLMNPDILSGYLSGLAPRDRQQ
jgi:hypothetical protein